MVNFAVPNETRVSSPCRESRGKTTPARRHPWSARPVGRVRGPTKKVAGAHTHQHQHQQHQRQQQQRGCMHPATFFWVNKTFFLCFCENKLSQHCQVPWYSHLAMQAVAGSGQRSACSQILQPQARYPHLYDSGAVLRLLQNYSSRHPESRTPRHEPKHEL